MADIKISLKLTTLPCICKAERDGMPSFFMEADNGTLSVGLYYDYHENPPLPSLLP